MINSRINTILLGYIFFCTAAFGATSDSLPAYALHPYGRADLNTHGDLELISTAVHVGFRFTGTECDIYVYIPDTAAHSYIQYTLDAVYQKRVRISGTVPGPLKIKGLGNGSHSIWLYKTTEASSGPIFIEKIVAHNVTALREPDRPLIEFIGNSITCGAASDASEIPCDLGDYHDHHNAYYAYGPRVARALHANFIMSCVSGIGIYRNWNSEGPVMPQVYEKTDFQLGSSRSWDFKKYHPRIVSIALGTNDFSDGDHIHPRLPFDSAIFVSSYIKFIQLVKSKYPGARVILLSSPMLNGAKRATLQNCLKAVKINTDKLYPMGNPVSLFFFKEMKPRGCGYHPSVEDHAIMAKELIPAFKKLL